jgi:hypothetical protein
MSVWHHATFFLELLSIEAGVIEQEISLRISLIQQFEFMPSSAVSRYPTVTSELKLPLPVFLIKEF